MYVEDAHRLMQKWCKNCEAVFEHTGEMWEKYNVVELDHVPEEGLYGSVSGFGWSNSVYADFIGLLRQFDNKLDGLDIVEVLEPEHA